MLNIAIRAARAAGNIIIRYYGRTDELTINSKRHNDFVSEVDRNAEHEIIKIIKRAYPKHAFLAEEAGKLGENDEYEWIIDPLDGTTNFLHNFPQFCVSIALHKKGIPEIAVIYNPVSQELYTAVRGGGAFLNEKRIRVSNRRSMEGALLATGFPFGENHKIDLYLQTLKPFMQQAAGVRRTGSAALDLAYVACGRCDGFWEFGLHSWDMAAGALLVKEAGGFISDLNGNDHYLQTGNIICANPKLHAQMLEIISLPAC